jgi:FixJ family two-component response regulator
MPHVLLVDNDSSMRRALTRTLQHAGYDVQAFASAEELLAAGPVDPHACMVLDLDLPGASGIELKKALNHAGCALPTVFITASAREGLSGQLASPSTVAVLHKPFSNDDLLAALDRAVARNAHLGC